MKNFRSKLKYKLSLLSMLALLFPLMQAQQALAATSDARVYLYEPFVTATSASDFQNNSSTPATATLLGVTGNAKSVLSTGSIGVGMDILPGSPFGFYTAAANWSDAWTVSGSYFGPAVPVVPTFTLNGSITTSLLTYSANFWDITFSYNVDNNNIFAFSADADGGPGSIRASSNGIYDISSLVQLSTNAVNPLLTDFSVSYTAPAFHVAFSSGSGRFNDSMSAMLRVHDAGPLTIDVFHTFRVNLTSLDPNVILTDEGGRSVSAAPVPEPETYAMLLAGLGLIGFMARRRKNITA